MDIEGLSAELFWWAMVLSLLAFVATLVAVPWVVAQLPSDYFSRPERTAWERPDQPVVAAVLAVAKNGLGGLLLLLGVLMLVTPGQGLLTILIGLLLLNFPGKFRLVRWLVQRPGVMKALNWIRRRHRVTPFEAP